MQTRNKEIEAQLSVKDDTVQIFIEMNKTLICANLCNLWFLFFTTDYTDLHRFFLIVGN